MGSDCPDFAGLLFDAWRRYPGKRLRHVLADAGFDSEANHCLARQDMMVRSWIKAGIGRPSKKPPSSRYRRLMSGLLRGSQRAKRYGSRAQAETGMSMLKRNLTDSLRSRSDRGRRAEMLLRTIVHNVMLLRSQRRVATEPIAADFELFLSGIGTIFFHRTEEDKRPLLARTVAREVGGEAGIPFWEGLVA